MKLKQIPFYLIVLMLMLAGCAESYIRSDAFIDPELVKSIYIMPITEEITIDSDSKMPIAELKSQVIQARELVKTTIKEQFQKRGYVVNGYGKDFFGLDKNNPQDELIRQSIFEFLKPSEDKPKKFVQKKEIVENEMVELFFGGTTQSKEESLVEKVIACAVIFPENTDTILFMNIKSHIAKKTFWNRNKEENTLHISIKMVSLTKKEAILSFSRNYEGQNILDKKQVESALKDILKNIPVKL